jgi:peptidyl-prolyl cis-trans isomerase C
MAQAYSIDQATKGSGGQLGWLFPGQVIKPIADVVVKMNKSAITTTPIQTSEGWVIIRLDDKRPFKFPSLEEAKPQLRQAMVQQYLVETVKKLRETAKIVQ